MSRFFSWRYQLLPGLLLLSAALTAGCVQQPPVAAVIEPRQSPNDERLYRYITLDNGLRALLISDAETEKAAASLDVYVGSAQNPADRAGLAHFLEHMLFLGADKYPEAAEYEEFITEHGGARNAYTAFEHTNYFFDIDQAYLAPALDRFAQFFIAPRFDAEYVMREINAVEAEYRLGIKTDSRRTLDVLREVVNPGHPFSILGVGTAETLADRPGDAVRDDLIQFYETYYSANLMTLAVLGRETPEQLEAMVRSRFAAVANRKTVVNDIEAPLYLPASLPGSVSIRSQTSQRQLQLSFPLPDYRQHYRRKSLFYIGNLLGHEGSGSLLALLKARGWAEGLAADAGLVWRGGSLFRVSITLTEQGLLEYQRVLAAVFEYIEMLRREGPSRALYEEQARIAAQHFRFRETTEPMRYVSALANDMHYYEPAEVLSGGFEMTGFKAAEISELVEKYLTPANALVFVISEDAPAERASQYYFTPYARTSVAADALWMLPKSGAIDPGLRLPAANAFVADNVDLRPGLKVREQTPRLLIDEPALSVWFSQDQEYRVPRGALYVSFRSARLNSARRVALAELYVRLLRDSVNEITYPAMLAGLNVSFHRHVRGISLKINGYDDKQRVLLGRIVEAIDGAQFEDDRFANIKADLIRDLENHKTTHPFQQVIARARQLLQGGEWSEAQLIAELETASPADMEQFAGAYWRDTQANALLHGNYTARDAAGLRQALAPLLANSAPGQPAQVAVMKLPAATEFVYPVDISHEDSVVFQYLQLPDNDWSGRALGALTGQLLKSGFFHQLRTQRQLGYVVSAFYWPLHDVPGVGLLVQSPSANAVEVAAAIDEFVETSLGNQGLTEQQFLRHRTALTGEIMQPHKNLAERSEYYWREIAGRRLDFDSRQRLAAAVAAIGFEQWRTRMREVLLNRPATVRIVSPGKWALTPGGEAVAGVSAFQNTLPRYTLP